MVVLQFVSLFVWTCVHFYVSVSMSEHGITHNIRRVDGRETPLGHVLSPLKVLSWCHIHHTQSPSFGLEKFGSDGRRRVKVASEAEALSHPACGCMQDLLALGTAFFKDTIALQPCHNKK